MSQDKSIGFIILRHVNNGYTNLYWNKSYDCIRKFYPENHIIIIDDNSNNEYLNSNRELYKTTIINGEYPGRGELLPYIYYLDNKLFDIAVIIHDSVFINKYIDFSVDTYKMLWQFEHHWDQIEDETKMINLFNDKELLDFYTDKNSWKGCFGGMSIITHQYLQSINDKYPLKYLLNLVLSRNRRCCFERVIACLLQLNNKQESLLGDIHKYCTFGMITFNNMDKYNNLPIIKAWTGR
jgi:hypothetical protein